MRKSELFWLQCPQRMAASQPCFLYSMGKTRCHGFPAMFVKCFGGKLGAMASQPCLWYVMRKTRCYGFPAMFVKCFGGKLGAMASQPCLWYVMRKTRCYGFPAMFVKCFGGKLGAMASQPCLRYVMRKIRCYGFPAMFVKCFGGKLGAMASQPCLWYVMRKTRCHGFPAMFVKCFGGKLGAMASQPCHSQALGIMNSQTSLHPMLRWTRSVGQPKSQRVRPKLSGHPLKKSKDWDTLNLLGSCDTFNYCALRPIINGVLKLSASWCTHGSKMYYQTNFHRCRFGT